MVFSVSLFGAEEQEELKPSNVQLMNQRRLHTDSFISDWVYIFTLTLTHGADSSLLFYWHLKSFFIWHEFNWAAWNFSWILSGFLFSDQSGDRKTSQHLLLTFLLLCWMFPNLYDVKPPKNREMSLYFVSNNSTNLCRVSQRRSNVKSFKRIRGRVKDRIQRTREQNNHDCIEKIQ